MRRLLTLWCFIAFAIPALALENENLLVRLPDGYKQAFSDRKNNMLMSEFVPIGQSVQNWTEMVTVQIFFGTKDVTPDQFRARMERLWGNACPNARSRSEASAAENGYATVLWRMDCPRNPQTGQPEITWFKALQGRDSLYVVQKAFKFVPSSAQNDEWAAWFRRVSVCDTRLPDRACPAAMR